MLMANFVNNSFEPKMKVKTFSKTGLYLTRLSLGLKRVCFYGKEICT